MKYVIEVKRTSFITYEFETETEEQAQDMALEWAEEYYGNDALYEVMNSGESK